MDRSRTSAAPNPLIVAAVAAMLASAVIGLSAFAQEMSPPMPNEYGAGAEAASPADQIPDPTAILNEDGSSFTIPIPGGGEIQVQGPESESPQTIAPTENWATQRNQPFAVGGTPIGPAPASK